MGGFDDIIEQMKSDQAATGTAPTPMDDAVRQMQEQDRAQASLAVSSSIDANADRAATNRTLAAHFNVAPEVVDRYPDEFRQHMATQIAHDTFANAPVLQRQVNENPALAPVIHDDVQNAAAIERTLGGRIANDVVDSPLTLLKGAGYTAAIGAKGAVMSVAGLLTLLDQPLGTHLADPLFSGMESLDDTASRLGVDPNATIVGKAAHMAGSVAGMIMESMITAPATATTAVNGSLEVLERMFAHGTQSMVIPSLANAIDTGQKVYTSTGDGVAAFQAAKAAYLSTTAMGVIPMSAPGGLAYRAAAGASSGLVTSELSRKYTNANMPESMRSPYSAEDQALQGIAGAMFGVMGPRAFPNGLHEAIPSILAEHDKAMEAQQDMTRLQILSQLSEASKWRARDQEGFNKFVSDVTEDGRLENVYVDGKVFRQELQKAGVTPEEIAQKMPEVAAQLHEVGETDGMVKIPTADYATSIAGTPVDQALLPHLRTDPEGMSYSDMQEHYATETGRMAELAKGINEKSGADEAWKTSEQNVHDTILQQLTEANRYPAQVNKLQAEIGKTVNSQLARRLGLTPEETYAQHGQHITDGSQGGERFEQALLDKATKNWQNGLKGLITGGRDYIPVVHTPSVLKEFQFKERNLDAPSRVISTIAEKHPDVPSDIVQNLPQYLHDPLYVFSHKDGGLRMVLRATTEKDEPIVVGVKDGRVQTITPIHDGEGVTGGDRMLGMVAQALTHRGAKVYATNKEALTEARASVLAEPGHNSSGGDSRYAATVFGKDHLVKKYGDDFYQPVYHGSPYRFDKFSLEHIGKGEGAQAYGWGLYFAGNKPVAEYYRRNLTANYPSFKDGRKLVGGIADANTSAERLAEIVLAPITSAEGGKKAIQKNKGYLGRNGVAIANKWLDDGEIVYPDNKGHTYEVDIPEDENFLLWDKPLSEQPEEVQKALGVPPDSLPEYAQLTEQMDKAREFTRESGEMLYQRLASEHGSDEAASKYLHSLGIAGIKYLDGSSRNTATLEITPPSRTVAGDWMVKGNDYNSKGVHFATEAEAKAYLEQEQEKAHHNYVVFDDKAVEILNSFNQEARGFYSPEYRLVGLLADANLSTYIHETGHYLVDTYARIASEADAPQEIKDDIAQLLFHVGVKDLEAWNGMSHEEQRPYHERLAKSFEQYFMEGKAPTIELQPVFARVKAWMMSIYRTLKELGTPLTPEVRGVFDRMFASEAAIKEAEAARGYWSLLKEKPADVPDAEWQAYQQLGQDATNIAIGEMQAKSLRDMQWTANLKDRAMRDANKEAQAARAEVTKEVAKEVDQMPVYRAQNFLKYGKLDIENPTAKQRRMLEDIAGMNTKLDLDVLKQMYGNGPAAPWRYLSTGKNGMATTKDGIHPDLAADILGYNSGDGLVRAVLEAESRSSVIEGITDQRMLEQHGELATPDAIERAAEAAIHNEVRARFMATGLKILTKSPIPARQIEKGAKEAADAAISAKKVGEVQPKLYAANERRANKEALRLAPTDPAAAAMAQRSALLNNQLTKSATEALSDEAKIVKYFKRFDKASIRDKLPGSFLEQIDTLLQQFDFRQVPTDSNRPKEALLAWANGLREIGYEPQIADWLVTMGRGRHYKDMTVEQLRGLHDTIRSIEATAKNMREITRKGEKVDLNSVVDAMRAKLDQRGEKFTKEQFINPPEEKTDGVFKSMTYRLGVWQRASDASLMPQEFRFNKYDRHEIDGIFHEMIYDPIIKANYKKVDMLRALSDEGQRMGELLGKDWQDHLYDLVNNDKLVDPRLAKEGKPPKMMKITRAKLLGIMRHTGNESNFEKLCQGYGWKPEDVWDFVTQHATAKDWQATQAHWDSFDPLWKETEAMIRRLGGLPPPKIPAREFETPFGKMRGGYSPIDYDPVSSRLSQRKGEFDLQPGDKVAGEGKPYSATTTTNGSLVARSQGYSDYVNLDLHSADSRMRDTIHDLAYREALLDATKIINHGGFRGKFEHVYGKEEYQALNGWLKGIRDTYVIDPSTRRFDNAFQYAKQGVVMTGVAYRLATVLKHGSSAALKSLGYLGNAEGASYFAAHVLRMSTGHLNEEIAGAQEKFAEIRTRMLQMDRDYKVGNRSMYEGEDWRAKNDRFGHAMVAWSDALSAIPTAWAAYDLAKTSGVPKSMGGTGKPMSEEAAVNYANSVVRQAHGTALESARSNFMNSKNSAISLFGTIYGFMNNSYGQTRDMYDKAFKGGEFSNNPALVARALTEVVLPGLLAHWVSTGGPGEDESKLAWAAKGIGLELASMVAFVRDAANMIEWEHGDHSVAPTRLIHDVVETGRDIAKEYNGDHSKLVQDLANMVGEWAHIGGLGQAGKTLQYLRDVHEGHEDRPDSAGQAIRDATLGPKHPRP